MATSNGNGKKRTSRSSRAPRAITGGGLSDVATAAPVAGAPSHDDIARRAYELWLDTGCSHGHEDENWFRAEEELREHRA